MGTEHRAITFKDLARVPVGSTGYFSLPGGSTAYAALTEDGWYVDKGRASGQARRIPVDRVQEELKAIAFTSHTGPANDEALVKARSEEIQRQVDIAAGPALRLSPADLKMVEGALFDKQIEQEGYYRGYQKDPKRYPDDCCPGCDGQNMQIEERLRQREALKAFAKDLERIRLAVQELSVDAGLCLRHGGPWGEDATCPDCTDEDGAPRKRLLQATALVGVQLPYRPGPDQGVPGGNPISLGASAVRAELWESQDSHADHGLTDEMRHRIDALPDEVIDQAVNSQVSDEFWAMYDDVRSRAITSLKDAHCADLEDPDE